MPEISNAAVNQVYKGFPPQARKRLLALRALILDVAASTEGVGDIEETLKWGEPAYLTSKSKSGSTIRLGWKSSAPDHCALYFICNTNLVDTFRALYPSLNCEGNRAILVPVKGALESDTLKQCVSMALTYHLDKRAAKRPVQRHRS